MTKRIGIYLYPDVEVLDFAGPFEVFKTANRVALRLRPNQEPPFAVTTIARGAGLVLARGGLPVQPDVTLDTTPLPDVLIVPGGVVDNELADERLMDWLRSAATHAQIMASVCTGAFILAKAGLLNDRPITTHWEDIPDLRRMFPALDVRENVRWVDDGDVVTAAGISAGIDMSLHLVARLAGQELAERTARQMEYMWNKG